MDTLRTEVKDLRDINDYLNSLLEKSKNENSELNEKLEKSQKMIEEMKEAMKKFFENFVLLTMPFGQPNDVKNIEVMMPRETYEKEIVPYNTMHEKLINAGKNIKENVTDTV